MRLSADQISRIMFLGACAFILLCYGFTIGRYQVFPFRIFWEAKQLLTESGETKRHYVEVNYAQEEIVKSTGDAHDGVNLITCFIPGNKMAAKIMDMDGTVIHEWVIDWFDLWPDQMDHLLQRQIPKQRPGTSIHGAVIMPNGELVFNFEGLGLVRLGIDGVPVWRLPYQTHHSVHLDEKGILWVCGRRMREEQMSKYPNYLPSFQEYTVLTVSGEGKITREVSVFELLQKNGLDGFLYMGVRDNYSTKTKGDTLHLNDVEPFPDHLEPGFFAQGDVLISLRNTNTILVFNWDSLEVKFVSVGKFVRQHDPDFIDAQTISVFDNNNVGTAKEGVTSRIVTLTAPSDELSVRFRGTKEFPFFTNIRGKHQLLPNGNVLITESGGGRAFEVNEEGKVVWQYINYVTPSKVGIVFEVMRLPREISLLYGSE